MEKLPEKWAIRQKLSERVCRWHRKTFNSNAHTKGCYIFLLNYSNGSEGYSIDAMSDVLPNDTVEITLKQFYKFIIKKGMKKETFTLPEKWALAKANNKEDSDLISEYARKIGGTHWLDKEQYPKQYHLHVNGEEYVRGESLIVDGYKLITIDEFKKHVLDKTNDKKIEPSKSPRVITHEQAQEIIDIACVKWKKDLAQMWGYSIVTKSSIEIDEEFYLKMRKACTLEQNKIFDKIFGQEFNGSMLEIGEMMMVADTESEYKGHIILKNYDCLVSLTNPLKTWNHCVKLKGKKLKSGTNVTIYAK